MHRLSTEMRRQMFPFSLIFSGFQGVFRGASQPNLDRLSGLRAATILGEYTWQKVEFEVRLKGRFEAVWPARKNPNQEHVD